MNELHALAAFIEALEKEPPPSPGTVGFLACRLRAARPTVPFDLEPQRGFGAPPIYSTLQLERQLDLCQRYADVRLWHSLNGRLQRMKT